jgi:hypothetical protein
MAQLKPYILVSGIYRSERSQEIIELKIRGKTEEKTYVELVSSLNLSSQDELFPDNELSLFARLDTENYMIGNLMLNDAYVKAGMSRISKFI